MNVLIYASSATGFRNAQDVECLRFLLKSLPFYQDVTSNFPTLGNLILVATHAGPQISDQQLFAENPEKGLLKVAADRVWRELKDIELVKQFTDYKPPFT